MNAPRTLRNGSTALLRFLAGGLLIALCSAAAGARPESGAISRELVFPNGEAQLRATVFLPRGRPAVSGVVVAHGASSGLRSHPMYRHLSETLPARGVAVLVFDRRGSGASIPATGRFSYDVLASDVVAARHALQSQLGKKSRPIGYWGYSQGGWIALLAANRDPDAAFVISVSAPLTRPDIQMITATRNILRIRGYDESVQNRAVAVRAMVDRHARGDASREQAQSALDSISGEPWFKEIYLAPVITDENILGWANDISHDPLEALSHLGMPVLLIYGAEDKWIPVSDSIRAAMETEKKNITLVAVAGADHALMTSLKPADQIEPSRSESFKPESELYFAVLGAWTSQVVGTPGPSRPDVDSASRSER